MIQALNSKVTVPKPSRRNPFTEDELLHPMRCKGWSFTGRMTPRLGQFLTGY